MEWYGRGKHSPKKGIRREIVSYSVWGNKSVRVVMTTRDKVQTMAHTHTLSLVDREWL